MSAPHPARFSKAILELLDRIVPPGKICDPFSGIGGCFALENPLRAVWGVEIEEEWITVHPRHIHGDSTKLNEYFKDGSFHSVVTSPCLEQSQRILTDDLRWVACGDLKVGDRILGFDETASGATAAGHLQRRRYRRGTVIRSVPKTVECVRVVLSNGDEIITTPNHPWLTSRYSYGGRAWNWVESENLIEPGGWSVFALKQFTPWRRLTSFEAGWLSGLMDGEGSVTMGTHGSPKLIICQKQGEVIDRAEALMRHFNYALNRITRTDVFDDGNQMDNLYFNGGFPGILQALGELRPMRLLTNWSRLDISTRCLHPTKVQVVRVELAGQRDIQEIETDIGTYFGEGYAHHNSYGNRMSDHHEAKDDSLRHTYRHYLGRPLSENNAGQMYAWNQDYWQLHSLVWSRCWDVLKPGGLLFLNTKDFIRNGQRVFLTAKHRQLLESIGFTQLVRHIVDTPGQRHGANRDKRVAYEFVTVYKKV